MQNPGGDWFCQTLDNEIRFKEEEEETKLILSAKEMISLYLQSPLDGVADAEYPFRVPLVNPTSRERLEVAIEGFIDLIDRIIAVIAHELAHIVLNHEITGASNYWSQQEAAWAKIREWGFEKEEKKHAAHHKWKVWYSDPDKNPMWKRKFERQYGRGSWKISSDRPKIK